MSYRRILLASLVLAALAIAITGCAGFDPHGWEDRPRQSPLPAHFVEVAVSELPRVCNNGHPSLQGCAVRLYSEAVCLIYTGPSPQRWLLAHELLHCAGFSHP
jgi:hypothetical protein